MNNNDTCHSTRQHYTTINNFICQAISKKFLKNRFLSKLVADIFSGAVGISLFNNTNCLTNFFYCYIIKILSVCSVLLKILNNGVFFMKKFGRDRIALFLTCMSVLGSRTSAMNTNKAQNPQSVAAVRGVTSRNDQFVKQGLTKNQKLGITAAITTLVAVPVIAFTIWGIKRHSKSEQDQHEKNKNVEKVDNGETDENKNEKLLDFFIKFLDSDFDYYSITKNNAEIVQITEEVCKTWNPFILDVRGLLGCIKDKKLEIDELKKVHKSFTDFKFNYRDNDNIELVIHSDEYENKNENKVTVTKINNNFVSAHLINPYRNVTIVLKAK